MEVRSLTDRCGYFEVLNKEPYMKAIDLLIGRMVLMLALVLAAWGARAQTVVLTENFSNTLTPAWTVGDSNATAPALWWGSVSDLYGTGFAHSRGGKGYCAALGLAGYVNPNARYSNNLASTMSRTVNLAPYSRANLRFWSYVPSIGAGDTWQTFLGTTALVNSATTNATWVERRFSLNNFVGASHLLRFVFTSGASGNAEGLYLDDIELTGANTPLTERISSLSLPGFSGYVISSDAANTNASFNRETINATTTLALENFTSGFTSLSYVVTYRLRETNGTLFPIFNTGGVTTNIGYTHVTTNLASIGLAQETNFPVIGALKPAARLDHLKRYRVEVEVARPGGPVLFSATNGPLQIYHFTNLVSGDVALNAIVENGDLGWQRTWLLNPAPGTNAFLLTNEVVVRRYDTFLSGVPSLDALPLRFEVELRDAVTDALIPLVAGTTNLSVFSSSYEPGTTAPVEPRVSTNSVTIAVRPAAQIDSVNATYRAIVRVSYTNQLGQPAIAAGSVTNAPQRLLAFNGRLICGDINTTMHAFSAVPVPGAVVPGSNVAVNVSIALNAGTVDGVDGPTFGNGSAIGTKLLANGDALFNSGTLFVNNAAEGSAGNISFSRGALVVSAAGALTASIDFHMPAGFGYHTNTSQARGLRRLLSDLSFPLVGLNQALAPKTNLTFYPAGGLIHAVEETKSIFILATQMVWNATSSRFELLFTPTYAESFHVRLLDYTLLQIVSSNLYQTNMAVKRANDRYMNHTLSFTGPALISADASGTALLNGTLAFTASGGFRTHFPYDSAVQWNAGGGFMVISNDAVVQGSGSYLTGVEPVSVPYVGDCEGCSSTPTTNRVGITPANGRLSFTRDGGLVGGNQGPLIYNGLSGKVAWGYVPGENDYAQAVNGPTNAVFAMSGGFLRGADNTSDTEDGPAVILFTGAHTGNVNLIERPGGQRYGVGIGDYAGLNVRGIADGEFSARSLIAGRAVNYQWRGNSKLYLRLGGVSGIHSAVAGTFPANLTLWGYNFGFSNYSLAFLDNDNVKSRTDGYIRLPEPSDINVEFQELKFTCAGKPNEAKISPNTQEKRLLYWNADITAHSLNFVSNVGAECDVDDGFLTLGVTGHAEPVSSPLYGTLGFFPNGKLISKSDGIAELDSRLKMPTTFELKGASNTTYRVTSVGDAYYNRHNPAPAPDGFINFVGQMDVPFFEDIRMQVHTSARKPSNDDPPVNLMGGWASDDTATESKGWLKNGESYFTAAYFDDKNDAWPLAVSLDTYRDNPDSDKYHPRARKIWLDIVELNYPLRWKFSSRNFESFEPVKEPLIVFTLEHKVRKMDAKAASLDFGATFGKINTSDFFLDNLEDAGLFDMISDVIGESEFATMLDGMLSFGDLVDAVGGDLLEQAVAPAINPDIDATYLGLKNLYNSLPANNKTAFPALADTYLTTNFMGTISNKLYRFIEGNNEAISVLKTVNEISVKAYDGSRSATNVFGKLSNHVVTAEKEIKKVMPGVAEDVGPWLKEVAADVQPTLNDITRVLHEVNIVLTNVGKITKTGGEWANEVKQIAESSKVVFGETTLAAKKDIKAFIQSFNYSVDNPFTQLSPTQFKDRMRREVREAFLESSIWNKVLKGVKFRLFDINAIFRSGVDGYFDGINGLVRAGLAVAFNAADEEINKALGDVGDYIGAAKITGNAEINDDSLRRLHIDAQFEFKMPDKMVFKGFLDILEIDSENRVETCIPAGGSGTEITIGALEVPLSWSAEAPKTGKKKGKEEPKDGLKVDVIGKFVLDADGDLSGMGGSILAKGKITLGSVEIKQFGLNLMFGETENYGAALCRVRVNNSIEVGGGLFAGVACTYDPITWTLAAVSHELVGLVDPKQNFGPLPVAGALFFADGEFPIWSYGCLLEIRVIAGAGAWYFNGGDNYGMIMRLGVSGTVVCVLSAKGVATLIGSPTDEGFTLFGTIGGEGCLGPCPFCICGDFEEAVKYIEGKGWQDVPDEDD